MSVTTDQECLSTFFSYLKKYMYVKLDREDDNSSVFYNMIDYDILTIIPNEFKDEKTNIYEFSDFICILADSSIKVDHPDQSIGIVYVDRKINSEESIIVARLPTLRSIDPVKRLSFLQSTALSDIYCPAWEYYKFHLDKESGPIDSTSKSPRNLENAKILIEQAITNYCKENNLNRGDITTTQIFVDYIIGDIFKYKFSVDDEQLLRNEAAHPDTIYPEILLKLLIKMGLLE